MSGGTEVAGPAEELGPYRMGTGVICPCRNYIGASEPSPTDIQPDYGNCIVYRNV
jgi:hypothetical protein